MDDCLGEFFAWVILQGTWALTIVNIGNHIARHQKLVIQLVIQLQHLVRLPKCVHIFSEDDRKIPETDIKTCAGILTFCFIFSSLVIAGPLLGGPRSWLGAIPRLVLLLIAVNSPFCILLWIYLACSARRRRRQARSVEWPIYKTEEGRWTEPKENSAATALATNQPTPEQQPLSWEHHELYLPVF